MQQGSAPCSEARSIFTRYYVTKLTFVEEPAGYARLLDGYRCTGGVEPRALVVCRRTGGLLEAERWAGPVGEAGAVRPLTS